jgi:hypothetical protein
MASLVGETFRAGASQDTDASDRKRRYASAVDRQGRTGLPNADVDRFRASRSLQNCDV